MTVRVLILLVVLLFGVALVETGQLANLANRFVRPSVRDTQRQVEVLTETSEYRVVKHPLGETRVPRSPQRIVSLTNAATDSLCALGVEPVLISTSWRRDSVTPYLQSQIAHIPKIRFGEAVDLETILKIEPDLIFAGTSRDGRLYNQLSKIAPTVCVDSSIRPYREIRLLDVAAVIGRADQADDRLQVFYRRVADARETLQAQTRGRPVSFLRFRRNTCVIYTRTTMFGPLLFDQLGLQPDPEMPMVMTGAGWDVLSVERLSKLRSEYIFIVVDRDSEIFLRRVEDTPIWKNIPAVAHGNVTRVDSGTWLSGDGILGCEAIIDDVMQAVSAEQESRVN